MRHFRAAQIRGVVVGSWKASESCKRSSRILEVFIVLVFSDSSHWCGLEQLDCPFLVQQIWVGEGSIDMLTVIRESQLVASLHSAAVLGPGGGVEVLDPCHVLLQQVAANVVLRPCKYP